MKQTPYSPGCSTQVQDNLNQPNKFTRSSLKQVARATTQLDTHTQTLSFLALEPSKSVPFSKLALIAKQTASAENKLTSQKAPHFLWKQYLHNSTLLELSSRTALSIEVFQLKNLETMLVQPKRLGNRASPHEITHVTLTCFPNMIKNTRKSQTHAKTLPNWLVSALAVTFQHNRPTHRRTQLIDKQSWRVSENEKIQQYRFMLPPSKTTRIRDHISESATCRLSLRRERFLAMTLKHSAQM